MVNLRNFIFKTTGLMTKKTILRKSEEIGLKTAEILKSKNKISQTEFQEIFNSTLGKKAQKIELVTDRNATIKALKEKLMMSEENAKHCYDSSLSLVIPAQRHNDKTFLNLRLDDLQGSSLVNIATHESEHALYDAFSANRNITKTILKYKPFKNLQEKLQKKYGEILNTKGINFQQEMIFFTNLQKTNGLNKNYKNIMELTGFKSLKSFKEFIQCILYGSNILEKGKNKQNFIISDVLKSSLKDETRAYHVGGRAEKLLYDIMGIKTEGLTSNSELRSELYKMMVKTLKKEERRAFKKWILQKLGISPSYKVEENSTRVYNKILNKIKKEQQNAIEIAKVKEQDKFWENAINYAV